MSTNKQPFTAIHPGELLKEELATRGVTIYQLSEQIDISYATLIEILNCEKSISPELAQKLEVTLGINADMLNKMQSEYDIMQTMR